MSSGLVRLAHDLARLGTGDLVPGYRSRRLGARPADAHTYLKLAGWVSYNGVSVFIQFAMQATPEQIAICTSQASPLKIKAGAGTGKTTTLRGLAARQRNQRMLYLAFNKAIKEDAVGKFGPHVRAMTAHGVAFAKVGKDYANVQDKLIHSELKPFHVLPALPKHKKSVPAALQNLYGGRIVETVRNFLVSEQPELGPEHVSRSSAPAEQKYFNPETMLLDAQALWEAMGDLSSPTPMTHDGYLKKFALTKPQLGYDTILLDEAQDTNPVVQAMFLQQPSRQVFVGDEHQAIYAFRGARNAMALMPAAEEHALTGSFRFGPAIAAVANAILSAKGESMQLQGLGGPSVLGAINLRAQHAYISRSNSALFARAIQALDDKETFAFVGVLNGYRFDLIEQTYRFSRGQAPSDPFLKAFETYEQLEEYADAMEDRELMGRCRLVRKYGSRLPTLVSLIQRHAGSYPEKPNAKVILTTAHRSKGLEFDQVQLANDFMDFQDEVTGQWRNLTNLPAHVTEDVNLQYVAVTRAKQRLELGERLDAFYRHRQGPVAALPVQKIAV